MGDEMTRIAWDSEDRTYNTGITQGVIYPDNAPGVPWNGLISVTESAEQTQETRYFDGQKFSNRNVIAAYSGSISAFTYPDELEPFIGISGVFMDQSRRSFGFSYRTLNEIHIIYNVIAAPSTRPYSTMATQVVPVEFEWAFTTLPEKIPGGKPTAHIVIMLDQADPATVTDLEAKLYGDASNDPLIPSIDDVIAIFESHAVVRITDNGDGTYTATGPDTNVYMNDSVRFTINWPSVTIIDTSTFTVSSL